MDSFWPLVAVVFAARSQSPDLTPESNCHHTRGGGNAVFVKDIRERRIWDFLNGRFWPKPSFRLSSVAASYSSASWKLDRQPGCQVSMKTPSL